ncbi:putative ryncolin-1-like [Apostichopus japonicus]|uniref:Putative ryncolin-1-like n=1 Tax=Stichopus japonicus TaxID=307972 RepID=A0A2G8LI59_STIJA|nr:putative ryncolin-1-like [Apostichopus japonicus]
MESNGGGWTVIQRRSSASVDFYLGWLDYKDGFGHKNQDHWLGINNIHSMTNQKTYQLRIDLRDSASSAYDAVYSTDSASSSNYAVYSKDSALPSYYAVYSTFSINNETDKYRLSVGSYSGNAGE